MNSKPVSWFRIVRAPFFTSILAPLFVGGLVAVTAGGSFYPLNFVLALIAGVGLHAATNVYNDIYDTLQGTDRVNPHRNEFSGGSGLLVGDPGLINRMFRIARSSLLIAFVAVLLLALRIDPDLRLLLALLYGLSAFFSKYYTAAPVKLSHRGLGEVSVWFAFGPMAVLFSAVSQNVAFHELVLVAMPVTGLSTTSILLVGEMIDRQADGETGKWGVAVRLGNPAAARILLGVHTLIMINIVAIALTVPNGWTAAIALVPYVLLLPRLIPMVLRNADNPDELKGAAALNVQLHMLFSILLVTGLLITVL